MAAQYTWLCDEYHDVFHDVSGLPPCQPLNHAIDLIDESLPPLILHHYHSSQVDWADIKLYICTVIDMWLDRTVCITLWCFNIVCLEKNWETLDLH